MCNRRTQARLRRGHDRGAQIAAEHADGGDGLGPGLQRTMVPASTGSLGLRSMAARVSSRRCSNTGMSCMGHCAAIA